MNRYYNPVRTVEGDGCLSRLPAVLAEMVLPEKRVLVLAWSRQALEHPAVAALLEKDSGFRAKGVVFTASNPTVEQLFQVWQETQDFAPEAVVAIGGGSVLDVGKSLCCLYGRDLKSVQDVREAVAGGKLRPAARWIGVPTTAGTGSEVTCWATIWDPEQDCKRSLESHENYAYAALVDPALAKGMPIRLAVSSALDAAAHAVESYWANHTNAVSRGLALEAVSTIMGGMHKRIPLIARDLKRLYTGFLIAALALFVLCSWLTEFNPMTLIANGEAFVEFITQDFLPPALPKASRIPGVLESVVVTLALALSSTTVAAILAFFVALFGSEKVSPFPKAAKFVRGFATFLRNIPALVWAFILFSSLGIGTGVGFVALCITSFAFLVRAFVETMEDVSEDCVESLQAVGASFPQRVSQAILPSCLSGFLSWFLYSVEVNIRASTIVGMVGGGGVGLTLFSYIKSFQYDVALSIILLVALMVIVVDQITGKLRKELLK